MFEYDRSAARGKMAVRELVVFKHDSELGCAPAWKLFEAVHVNRNDPQDPTPARSYQDYTVTVDEVLPSRRDHLHPHGVTIYREEDLLPLSGIQHFAFCRRQWALIHVEHQWQENLRTVEGNLLHQRAHDASLRERRGDLLILRGLSIVSNALGLSGQCDVVEFHASSEGVPLHGEDGLWLPFPVEYKRGAPKHTRRMNSSSAPKPCAWRRCSAVLSLRVHSFMESRGQQSPFHQNCGERVQSYSDGCTSFTVVGIHRKQSPASLVAPALFKGPLPAPTDPARIRVQLSEEGHGGTDMKHLLNTLFVTSEDIYLSLDGENVVANQEHQEIARYPLHTLAGIISFSYPVHPRSHGCLCAAGHLVGILYPRGDASWPALPEQVREMYCFAVPSTESQMIRTPVAESPAA